MAALTKPIILNETYGEKMEKLIPDAGLVKVQGAGHYSFLEAPELVSRVVKSFLKIN